MSDEQEPEELLVALWPQLVGSLTLLTGDRLLAEELAQDTVVRSWERWSRVRRSDNPAAYVQRMATNAARSRFRRLGAERRATARLGERPELAESEDHAQRLTVRAAVASLPQRQREALVHRHYLGASVAETAAAMRCAEGTVKSLTHKALAALRLAGLRETQEVQE